MHAACRIYSLNSVAFGLWRSSRLQIILVVVNSLKSRLVTDVSIYAKPIMEIIRDLQSQPMLDEKQLGVILSSH